MRDNDFPETIHKTDHRFVHIIRMSLVFRCRWRCPSSRRLGWFDVAFSDAQCSWQYWRIILLLLLQSGNIRARCGIG